ncbi:hypothetical protein PMAYCL1PPCAC_00375, partial [Pristionchus mayeri]
SRFLSVGITFHPGAIPCLQNSFEQFSLPFAHFHHCDLITYESTMSSKADVSTTKDSYANMRRQAYRKKMTIVGDGSVGKTCLFTVCAHDRFPEEYIPTVFEGWVQEIEVDGKLVELAFWDTTGEWRGDPNYEKWRPLSYPETDIILIICAIDSPDSFENVERKWAHEVRQYCSNVPIILVGNKKELRTDPETIRALQKLEQKPVKTERGRAIARRIGAAAYMECSAKHKEGVREIFEKAALLTLQPKGNKCVIL